MSDHSHQPATNNTYAHRTFDRSAAVLSSHLPVESTICWQLWEARQAYFYQRCLGWLHGNQADADDAFNTAALAVWRATHEQMLTLVNPMGWLTGVVRHACLDLLRKRQQEARQTVALDDDIDTEVWAEAPSRAPLYRSPEVIFLQREQCAYLQAEMAALPMRLRVPLALRCSEELSYEEIAAQLGLTTPTVRKRVQEARLLLARKFRQYHCGQAGPDWHAPWPDEQTLLAAPPASPMVNDNEMASIQPRVTPLAQISKREEQKLRTLRAYVAAYPTGWKKRLELDDQLCKMGMPVEAVVVYEQVLEKQPQLLSVWVQVGRLYMALQRGEAAVAAYARALALAVTDAQHEAIAGLVEGALADSA